MKMEIINNSLFLIPETDLIASSIEPLRDFFREQLRSQAGFDAVVLDAAGIETVDSLGVNLIIGLYKQVSSEDKSFRIVNAGEKFTKISNFFKFPSLFKVEPEEIKE